MNAHEAVTLAPEYAEGYLALSLRVKVTGARSEIELPPMPAAPRAVRFNDLVGVLTVVKESKWAE